MSGDPFFFDRTLTRTTPTGSTAGIAASIQMKPRGREGADPWKVFIDPAFVGSFARNDHLVDDQGRTFRALDVYNTPDGWEINALEGLYQHSVTLRTVSLAGKDPILGLPGTPTNTDLLIAPPPLVENVSVEYIKESAGVIMMGDLIVRHISRFPAYDALVIDAVTGNPNPKTVWVIAGPAFAGTYSAVDGMAARVGLLGWDVTVRRKYQ